MRGNGSSRVLVVDDEENIRLVLKTMLQQHGFNVHAVGSAEEALACLADVDPDFVLADVRLGGMDGIELCRVMKERRSRATIVVMSAFGNVDLALSALQAGAYDYVSKPFKRDEVLLTLRKAAEREALRHENRVLKARLAETARRGALLGQSAAMKRVFALIDKVAPHASTVLIQGASGTGKELVARSIVEGSPRAEAPFVAVNCGAIPATMMESELFGHRKGAFTDARSDRPGLFEQADGGTLFLDEIGELALALQVKLLRVLQEGRVRRLGDTQDRAVDVRVIAASLRRLTDEVSAGRFREDLFYRLHVIAIDLPPLRERREDIPLLVDAFIARHNRRLGLAVEGIDKAARARLLAYRWPGNVRELQNVVERAMVLSERAWIGEDDLPERLREPEVAEQALSRGELSVKKTMRFVEESLIRRALTRTGGNRTQACRLLEISHRSLLYKLKEYGIA